MGRRGSLSLLHTTRLGVLCQLLCHNPVLVCREGKRSPLLSSACKVVAESLPMALKSNLTSPGRGAFSNKITRSVDLFPTLSVPMQAPASVPSIALPLLMTDGFIWSRGE